MSTIGSNAANSFCSLLESASEDGSTAPWHSLEPVSCRLRAGTYQLFRQNCLPIGEPIEFFRNAWNSEQVFNPCDPKALNEYP